MWLRSSQMEKIFGSGFYTAYMSPCVCRRGGYYHQQFYNVSLLFNFFHYKFFKKERFHFGLNEVCSTIQSNILQFFLWMQIKPRYLYYGLVQTDFSPILIYLAQPPNWKFIQVTLRVRTSLPKMKTTCISKAGVSLSKSLLSKEHVRPWKGPCLCVVWTFRKFVQELGSQPGLPAS